MPDSTPSLVTRPSKQPLSRAVILAVLATSLMVGAFAISSQSYWIDEALSLIVATASSPAEAWKYMQAVSGSTLQMPLYQVYLFGWHKALGSGEWSMRASNLPWFVFGQLAFLILLRQRPKLALLGCLLAAVSPILWIYLDETRPYIMQYAATCWLTASLVRLTAKSSTFATADPKPLSRVEIMVVVAATLVLFASSLVGAIWAGAFALAIGSVFAREKSGRPEATPTLWLVGIIALTLFFGLCGYYVVTWNDAGRGYHRGGVSLLSFPFIAYELLGFSGFGPGKLQMRAAPVASVLGSITALLPLTVTFVTFALFAVFAARPHARNNHQAITAWLLALALPALVIFAAMFLFDHRPLPRHFIPTLPAFILLLAFLLQHAFTQKSILRRAIALLLPLLWLVSACNYRLQPAHAKDDYRTAAKVAAAALAENKEVWWAADPAAAYIYLTPIALQEVPGRAWAMQAPSWDDIRFKFPPRVIAISKPDIYDPQGAVARYAAENHFVPAMQLQAFTIFVRDGEKLPASIP